MDGILNAVVESHVMVKQSLALLDSEIVRLNDNISLLKLQAEVALPSIFST